jgi:ribonuclease Y
MPHAVYLIFSVAAVVFGALFGWLLRGKLGRMKVAQAETIAQRVLDEARKEAEIRKKEAVLEAKDEWYKAKANFERQIENQRREIAREEQAIRQRGEEVDQKADVLQRREREQANRERTLAGREKGLVTRGEELSRLIEQQNVQLERIANMTAEDAKKLLMQNLEGEARLAVAARVKEIREKAEQNAEREARDIIVGAIYRCAADHTVETTVSVVSLPSDEMKGRIIGREGRNIRAFETATGVDVIVDDTPEAIILSAFDPVRREVAKMAMEKLIQDGRIHPSRIEELVEKAQAEMEVIIREAGEQACFELGIHGLHAELVRMLGRLHYRTSYGQNVLAHTKEVSMLCGIMAAELGLDPDLAKRAGLLHDIGKAIDRETEGTHTEIGAKFAARYNEHPVVINAIAAHHGDVPQETPYPVLVAAADAVSGSRPGARREPLEGYVKRLEKLEELADSFKGVAKAFAIQAGREVRVIIEPQEVDDLGAQNLASEIAQKIQTELQYPGQIRVTVIRETRAVSYAR